MPESFILVFIIGCEIAFWVFIFAGLAARYLLQMKRLSTVLLICVPLIDLALLAATVVDLNRGTVASFVHGLAAAYLGFSVAFGGVSVSWADAWFARKFANGPPAQPPPTHGWPLIRSELVWWSRCLLAAAITIVLTQLAILYIDDAVRSEELELWLTLPAVTAGVWFVFGPLWVSLFNRSPKVGKPPTVS